MTSASPVRSRSTLVQIPLRPDDATDVACRPLSGAEVRGNNIRAWVESGRKSGGSPMRTIDFLIARTFYKYFISSSSRRSLTRSCVCALTYLKVQSRGRLRTSAWSRVLFGAHFTSRTNRMDARTDGEWDREWVSRAKAVLCGCATTT